MKTIREVLQLSKQYVSSKNREVAPYEVEEIIAHVLGVNRLDLYLNFDRPLEEEELTLMRSNIKRLIEGEPVQSIEGFTEFFGCQIVLNREVLIPRPETEQIVEHVATVLEEKDISGKTLWDMCTGSGCIGISLKKRFPELNVVLSDICPAALTVAKKNAQENQVEVAIVQGDLFEPFSGKKADFIIANPPYISREEFATLSPSVTQFEPQRALLAENSGLDFYLRFAPLMKEHLAPGGKAWFECGYLQGEKVRDIFIEHGYTLEPFYDLAGILRAVEVFKT